MLSMSWTWEQTQPKKKQEFFGSLHWHQVMMDVCWAKSTTIGVFGANMVIWQLRVTTPHRDISSLSSPTANFSHLLSHLRQRMLGLSWTLVRGWAWLDQDYGCNKLRDKLRDKLDEPKMSGRDQDIPVNMSAWDQGHDIPVNMHHMVLVLTGQVRWVESCERSVLVQLSSQLTWSWSWPGRQEEHTSLI